MGRERGRKGFARVQLALAQALWENHRVFGVRSDDWAAQPGTWDEIGEELRQIYLYHARELLITFKARGISIKVEKRGKEER